jgi:hypothetical protein
MNCQQNSNNNQRMIAQPREKGPCQRKAHTSRANQWFPSSGACILETRETTDGSTELKFSKLRSTRVHHEIAAMSIQPCSKASNENANPDNAIISSMRKSSEIERNETDVITDRNKKVQTRTVVLSNAIVPSTGFRRNLSQTVVANTKGGRSVKTTGGIQD